MKLTKQDKINRSKLKRDCIHYQIAVHNIICCVFSNKPKCFTEIDQCVGCKNYKSVNDALKE